MSRINERFYISSGAKNKMYTLRVRFDEPRFSSFNGRTSVVGVVHRDWHVQSLSNDKERAIQKARELVNKNLDISFEVDEWATPTKREEGNPMVIRFGKYFGLTLDHVKEIDPQYLIWVAESYSNPKHKDFVEFVKEYMKVELQEKWEKAKEVMEIEEEIKAKRAVIIKEIGETLQTLSWDFPQNIGRDMIQGNLPKGRGKHLVCDMMGKIQGRRNSKKYKAEYQRVEDLIFKAEQI